jgi:tyrosine decarboxylase/aspartate 1-decarboxylase
VSDASARARKLFEEAARRQLHLALAELPVEFFDLGRVDKDRPTLTCLRSVLMKPEHREWADRIWEIISDAMEATH